MKCRFEANYNFGKIVYKMIKNKIKTKNYYKWQDARVRMRLKRDATDPLNSLYFNIVKTLSLPVNKCLPPWPFSRSGVPDVSILWPKHLNKQMLIVLNFMLQNWLCLYYGFETSFQNRKHKLTWMNYGFCIFKTKNVELLSHVI